LLNNSENAFLALRVTFFNEMYLAHKSQKCESTYEQFAEMVGLDERIGHSHSQVPGTDGKIWMGKSLLNKR